MGRLMRITGPRGSGKTVLLTELGELVAQQGWNVVNVVSDEDVLDSIRRQLLRSLHVARAAVTANLPFVSAEVDVAELPADATFREVFEYEVRRYTKSEELASIPIDEVAVALKASIERSGLHIEDEALACAARATEGYAYLTQLVGHSVWRVARRHAATSLIISQHDVKEGVQVARDEYERAVLDTALADLTLPSVQYLLSMCVDEGASSTGEIARRMGKPTADANSYRRILIARQIIEATAPGYVAFSMPRMKEYLERNKDRILARYGR